MQERQIAPGVWAYLAGRGGWGWSNAGLVAGDGGAGLLFDTRMTLAQGRELVEAAHAHTPRLEAAVYSHGNADHTWGSWALGEDTRIVASAATAEELSHEVTPAGLRAVMGAGEAAEQEGSAAGSGAAYFREHMGWVDTTGLPDEGPRRPDTTYTGRTELAVGGRDTELIQVGPAHTAGDTVLHVPDAGVVFGGDVLFFEDHPISWGHPLTGWLQALRTLLDTGAHTFVPGHGPVVGRTEVADLLAYLEKLHSYAADSAAAGLPLAEAAARMPTDARWQQPERAASVLLAGYRAEGAGEQLHQMGIADLIAGMRRDLGGGAGNAQD
ncbi:MBL fold metallo-hydrolase [Streptomyces sp. ODS28]|uniref:MBL fold metallo-hydrolase n=1 Tax=Streptomyces sp. ODS28 TaxID=3136688 RepID=UPI0031E57653